MGRFFGQETKLSEKELEQVVPLLEDDEIEFNVTPRKPTRIELEKRAKEKYTIADIEEPLVQTAFPPFISTQPAPGKTTKKPTLFQEIRPAPFPSEETEIDKNGHQIHTESGANLTIGRWLDKSRKDYEFTLKIKEPNFKPTTPSRRKM